MSDHNENDCRVRAAQGMQHKAQGVHAQEAGQIDMSAIPPAAVELGHIFADAGYELALVGGSVRDILLGRPAHDLDSKTHTSRFLLRFRHIHIRNALTITFQKHIFCIAVLALDVSLNSNIHEFRLKLHAIADTPQLVASNQR